MAFYRPAGVPLGDGRHEEDGPVHYAAELGEVHVAVYDAAAGYAPGFREGGCTFPGLLVDDLGAALERVQGLGASVLSGPEERPWGVRAVVGDPDGLPVERWAAAG